MKKAINSEPPDTQKKRVCAYCRVSTGNEDQQDSFLTQVSYYTNLIQEISVWEFAGIFADEGISGTSKTKRLEFLRLINECEKGKIDMVITKSISRFARNTVDCIQTVRKLKTMGIAVFFEKENINTLSSQSELFLTVLSSVAQEESMSKSKNIKWRYKTDFEKGVYNQGTMPYGYIMADGEKFIPHPEQAEVVKRIYHDYLNGKSCVQIARALTDEKIPTYFNAKSWSVHAVTEILKSERYIGDMLLQKYYTSDHDITFQSKINYGEKDKYYVADTHTPIISKSDYENVQRLLALNAPNRNKRQQTYPLSKKIECGVCGRTYVRKKAESKAGSKISWLCHNDSGIHPSCKNNTISESEILEAYRTMIRKLKYNNCQLLRNLQADLKKVFWEDEYENEISEINNQLLQLAKQSQILSRLRSEGNLDSAIFMDKSDELNKRMSQLKNHKSILMKNQEDDNRLIKTDMLIKWINNTSDTPTGEINYDEFFRIVNKITINPAKTIRFTLINGLELTERAAC